MKKTVFGLVLCALVFLTFQGCATMTATNPYTNKRTLALPSQSRAKLNSEAAAFYSQVRSEELYGKIITGTPEAQMVQQVGENLRQAAEMWAESRGSREYLNDYSWEYILVENEEANAWCAAGGKICVYSGILPYTQNEQGLAMVLGHELSHALLNHSQQRASAAELQSMANLVLAAGLVVGTASAQKKENQSLLESIAANTTAESFQSSLATANFVTSLAGALPYSRSHETESDKIGFALMLIAGYNALEGVRFAERFYGGSGKLLDGILQIFSTHPTGTWRTEAIKKSLPEARNIANQVIAYRKEHYGE